MIHRMFIKAALTIILFSSCEKESIQSNGFNSQFRSDSYGQTSISVSSSHNVVMLSGYINTVEGSVIVTMISPSGNSIFHERVEAPASLCIVKSFVAEPGFWTISYKSIQGKGTITLHVLVMD